MDFGNTVGDHFDHEIHPDETQKPTMPPLPEYRILYNGEDWGRESYDIQTLREIIFKQQNINRERWNRHKLNYQIWNIRTGQLVEEGRYERRKRGKHEHQTTISRGAG